MLSKKIINYLNKNADKNPPELQKKYQNSLLSLGLSFEKNSSFLDFMIQYSDEYSGSEGFIIDVASDLLDIENSTTEHLRKNYALHADYISLFNTEIDDFLLYNIKNDSVKLIEAENIKKLSEYEYHDKNWSSFNDFLEDFFEL